MWWTAAALAREPDPTELVARFDQIRTAVDRGDEATAAAATRALLVDAKTLARVLRPDAPPAFVDGVLAQAATWGEATDGQVARLLAPEGRTECRALSATTEAIRDHRAPNFPGGAVELSQRVLADDVTWFEVSCTAPGEPLGTVFHLFFVDKHHQWRMLGPAWRVLPELP